MLDLGLLQIADSSNLIVEVTEFDKTIVLEPRQQPLPLRRQRFAVDRATLKKSSQHAVILLDPSDQSKEVTGDLIVLKDDNLTAMEIWLRVLHHKLLHDDRDLPVAMMRQIVKAADKYDFDITLMEDWFDGWYDNWDTTHKGEWMTVVEVSALLYPTWRFNHAEGFARVTEFLAYKCNSHIMEIRRNDDLELHLPSRIIQQVNAARGSLRVQLHKKLFGVVIDLFRARCTCKEKTLYGYEKALFIVHVWPLETEAAHNSIKEILKRMKRFQYTAQPGSCISCSQDYMFIVNDAHRYVKNYFDGLCLDCMDKSNPKTGDIDLDYWEHHKLKDWDRGCRIAHGQPSWWFSFMGRKEDRDRFEKEHPKKNSNPRAYTELIEAQTQRLSDTSIRDDDDASIQPGNDTSLGIDGEASLLTDNDTSLQTDDNTSFQTRVVAESETPTHGDKLIPCVKWGPFR